ncbi:MAG: hypothetical protein FGM37_01685 [Phycisphaerales bacterium]|nr:hypothetical protein [Phycisphaerales bacterium]
MSKPITLLTVDAHGQPVADAVVYQHGVGFFSPVPLRRKTPRTTQGDGTLPIVLDSRTSSLTILKPYFEPVQLVVAMTGQVVPAEVPAPATPEVPVVVDARDGEVTDFAALPDHATVRVGMSQCARRAAHIAVADERGMPVPDAEVHRVCTLFLLNRGTEETLGLPPIESARTDSAGRASVEVLGGLANHVYVRAPGRVAQRLAVDASSPGTSPLRVMLPEAPVRQLRIRVLQGPKSPVVAEASVTLGLQLDGMPQDPNGWTALTDAEGLTREVAVSQQQPIIFTVSKGKQVRRQTVTWDEVERAASRGELTLFMGGR